MKKILLSTAILMFSLFVIACSSDDDGDPQVPGNPANNDPTVTINITGAIEETISFTIEGGIMTDQSVIGSYVGVADLLTIGIMQLPTGYAFNLVGNRATFGEGEFVSSGVSGHGAYTDGSSGSAFIGTSSTITLTSLALLQNVVQATYSADGSFSVTMEDQSTPPQVIQVNGEFENITLQVNE